MKYVLEKNGSAVSNTVPWTLKIAEKCGLAGNAYAPPVPYQLSDGRTLRAVRFERAAYTEFQITADNPGSLVGDEWVITQTVTDKPAEQVREIQTAKIKAEAGHRIEAIALLWKQVAGGERAIELIEIKAERAWTPEEQIEADYLRSKRNEIAAIRTKSDELESLANDELKALDVHDDANWITAP